MAATASAPLLRRRCEASFDVPAPIERVFPLFDAVEEQKWAEGWRIEPVQPVPFRVERNAVFLTGAGPERAVWTVLRFDAALHEAEYLVVAQDFQQRWIRVRCASEGGGTRVTVSYDVTALG